MCHSIVEERERERERENGGERVLPTYRSWSISSILLSFCVLALRNLDELAYERVPWFWWRWRWWLLEEEEEEEAALPFLSLPWFSSWHMEPSKNPWILLYVLLWRSPRWQHINISEEEEEEVEKRGRARAKRFLTAPCMLITAINSTTINADIYVAYCSVSWDVRWTYMRWT